MTSNYPLDWKQIPAASRGTKRANQEHPSCRNTGRGSCDGDELCSAVAGRATAGRTAARQPLSDLYERNHVTYVTDQRGQTTPAGGRCRQCQDRRFQAGHLRRDAAARSAVVGKCPVGGSASKRFSTGSSRFTRRFLAAATIRPDTDRCR